MCSNVRPVAKCKLSANELFSKKKLDKDGNMLGGGDDPYTYTGKSCKVSKSFGKATTDIYGADPFSLNPGALLGKGIDTSSGIGAASVSINGSVVGNATATGGK